MGEETTKPDSTEGINAEHADDLDVEADAEPEETAEDSAEVAAEVDDGEQADGDAGRGAEGASGVDEDALAADDADAGADAEADADAYTDNDADAGADVDADADADAVIGADGGAPAPENALGAQLWEAIASAALLRAQPQFDETVLDTWCGDGAAALPTAALVGPFGRVDAIDPDEGLIALARERAGGQVPQLHIDIADPAEWGTTGYDLVQCVLGLASCDTPDETARHLVSLAKPGGRVVLALWAHDAFAALDDLARAALAAEEVAPEASAQPLAGTAGTLATFLHDLGLTAVRAERVERHAALDPELAWRLVLSARRVPLDGLDDAAVERVRERFLASAEAADLEHVDVSTLIAVGHTPA